jgi:hypothetical protein
LKKANPGRLAAACAFIYKRKSVFIIASVFLDPYIGTEELKNIMCWCACISFSLTFLLFLCSRYDCLTTYARTPHTKTYTRVYTRLLLLKFKTQFNFCPSKKASIGRSQELYPNQRLTSKATLENNTLTMPTIYGFLLTIFITNINKELKFITHRITHSYVSNEDMLSSLLRLFDACTRIDPKERYIFFLSLSLQCS